MECVTPVDDIALFNLERISGCHQTKHVLGPANVGLLRGPRSGPAPTSERVVAGASGPRPGRSPDGSDLRSFSGTVSCVLIFSCCIETSFLRHLSCGTCSILS